MAVTIEHLYLKPQRLPAVAALIYETFWSGRDGYSLADLRSFLRSATDPGKIPLCLMAIEGGHLVGTVSLIVSDDESRPHLTPGSPRS